MDTADSVLFVGIVLSFGIAMICTVLAYIAQIKEAKEEETEFGNWEFTKIFCGFFVGSWFWGFIIFLLFNRLF